MFEKISTTESYAIIFAELFNISCPRHLTKLTVDDRKQSNHDVKSELLATSPLHHDSHIYLYQ